jgi:hypothetical protein
MGVTSQAFGGSNLFHAKLVVVHGQLKLAAGTPIGATQAAVVPMMRIALAVEFHSTTQWHEPQSTKV